MESLESGGGDFRVCDVWAEGVTRSLGLRRRRGTAAWATIAHDEAAATRECQSQRLERRRWSGQLVIGVDDEHGIDRRRVQTRIVVLASHYVNLPLAPQQPPDPQERQRLTQHVDSDHASGRSDDRRQTHREVAAPGSEIDDDITTVEIECGDDVVRALPRIALPLDLLEVHEREGGLPGNVAAHAQRYEGNDQERSTPHALHRSYRLRRGDRL